MTETNAGRLTSGAFDAVLFDLDGVLTPTADIHMRAWRQLFTDYFESRGIEPAYGDADYFRWIDGKPRYEGVRDMLAARGVELPWGEPSDPPSAETVCGLGNRKNDVFAAIIARDGVDPYPGSVRLLGELVASGIGVAVVSSSKNADAVLRAAGLRDRFGVLVDGVRASAEGLAGKPAPDTYLRAAELLGSSAASAVVVEDALSGVASGRAGRFGLVVGVDRGVGRAPLIEAGADIVVADLADLCERTTS